MGRIDAAMPRMSSRFIRLLPATFPTRRFPLPAVIARMPAASSGADVPMDTIVRPMIRGETPSRRASRVPYRTMTSAPPISRAIPARSIM